ncbi:hypothetical protein SK128_004270, partial [Halocaridina rubra]
EMKACKCGRQTVLCELLAAMHRQLPKVIKHNMNFNNDNKFVACQVNIFRFLQHSVIPISRVSNSDGFHSPGGEQSEIIDHRNSNDEPLDWHILPLEASFLPTGDWVPFENLEVVLANKAFDPIPAATAWTLHVQRLLLSQHTQFLKWLKLVLILEQLLKQKTPSLNLLNTLLKHETIHALSECLHCLVQCGHLDHLPAPSSHFLALPLSSCPSISTTPPFPLLHPLCGT